ncbi:MAG: hypothetical protein JSV09_08585 [Thermoplasmata archaeon]|nr:MAG: hypothetical protein JSV09_08585 [Thermoplasmata archaeon]
MELYKIEDVDFSINQDLDNDVNINLIWKEGELYLSLKNLVLTDKKRWYDIPLKELENVQIISENPTKLKFELPNLEIIVTGRYAERLLALRHFLLPYIQPKREEIMKKSMDILIKFWHLGVRNPGALASILPVTTDEIRKLITSAKEKDLIDNEGRLTEKGYERFIPEERELLRKLVITNG